MVKGYEKDISIFSSGEVMMQQGRVVVEFNAAELGAGLADALVAPLISASVLRFADTESDVAVTPSFDAVAGKEIVLVAQFGGSFAAWSVNDFLLSLCFLSSRIKSAGATSLTCVLPYLPYARQDVLGVHGGVSSALLLIDLLQGAGVDRLMTVDMHAPKILELAKMPVCNFSSTLFWADYIASFMSVLGHKKYVLVAPDNGAALRAQVLAQILGIEVCFITKMRMEVNHATAVGLAGEVSERYALLVDDIVDTGRTAFAAAALVLARGAVGVSAFFTHPVLSAASMAVMQPSAFDQVVVTNSLHKTALSYDVLRYVSLNSFIISSVLKQLSHQNFTQVDCLQSVYEQSV